MINTRQTCPANSSLSTRGQWWQFHGNVIKILEARNIAWHLHDSWHVTMLTTQLICSRHLIELVVYVLGGIDFVRVFLLSSRRWSLIFQEIQNFVFVVHAAHILWLLKPTTSSVYHGRIVLNHWPDTLNRRMIISSWVVLVLEEKVPVLIVCEIWRHCVCAHNLWTCAWKMEHDTFGLVGLGNGVICNSGLWVRS